MKIGCVVMAAGRSTRFGKNKLFAPLAGKPLLSHVLEALPRQRFSRIVAVTSDDTVSDLCKAHGITAVQYGGGPQSETVRRGIGQMDGMDACLFVQGDQPLCTPRSIIRLLDSFAQAPESVHRLSFHGTAGSPVLFPSCIFYAFCTLEGEQGGMAAARATGADIRFVPADSAEELMDADTEKALSEIEKIYFEKSL